MVSYKDHDALIKKVYENGHGHVFAHWDNLSDSEKDQLIKQLSDIDFSLARRLFSEKHAITHMDFEPAPYIALPSSEKEKKTREDAEQAGLDHIRKGRVAAFIVAGGQGSRLGFEGPKGKFPIGPVSGNTLFQFHGEKILKYSRKYDVSIPWFVMTSDANHEETVAYFKEMNNFGLPQADVKIFQQNMLPSLDSEGRLILETKNTLFKNPDGHGGSLTALYTSGAIEDMKKRGIETISYFQVDNPLVKIMDPVFIGFHVQSRADVSSKAIAKAYPEEKVGVFVKFSSGRIGVVEYSDLTQEQTLARDAKARLLFNSANVAIHLFSVDFVDRLTQGREISLPFHTAKKKIKAYSESGPREIDGYKFEKFVFDALPLTEKNIVFETSREEEFAPVKNAEGVDSIDSARELMMNQYRTMLASRNIAVPAAVKKLEISPVLAVDSEDLDPGLRLPEEENIFIK